MKVKIIPRGSRNDQVRRRGVEEYLSNGADLVMSFFFEDNIYSANSLASCFPISPASFAELQTNHLLLADSPDLSA